jgi:hypothetical protein
MHTKILFGNLAGGEPLGGATRTRKDNLDNFVMYLLDTTGFKYLMRWSNGAVLVLGSKRTGNSYIICIHI